MRYKGNFFNDKEKIKDLFLLSKPNFMNTYNISEEIYIWMENILRDIGITQ